MSIRVIERPKQAGTVQFRGPTATREYIATGDTSKLNIQIAIASTAPATETTIEANGGVLTLFLQKISLREIGGGSWEATVDYGDTPNQFDLKLNIGTQTTKRQQALQHIITYDCLQSGSRTGSGDLRAGVPDFNGAIGVNGQEIAGVDVEIAKVELVITLKLSFASLASSYFWTVANMTPSVNAEDYTINFKGQNFLFPKGSLLFRGAPMTVNSDAEVNISFMFAYSRNLTVTTAAWSSTKDYVAGDQVTYGGHIFTSVGGNLNHVPVFLEWEASQTYDLGEAVIWSGNIYTSVIASNTNNQPTLHVPDDWLNNGPVQWTDGGPSAAALTVGNSDPIIAEGWWYKWPFYGTQVSALGAARAVPQAIVIDRVYDYADFTELQIPGASN